MDRASHSRASSRARLPVAAALLLALLCALALSVARAGAVEADEEPPLDPNSEPPSFVVIQTDDQTLDGLYATFTPSAAAEDPGDAEHARPDRRARHDLQPLLRLLPALLPLAGQPADRPLRPQHTASRATSSPTAATSASPSAAAATPQPRHLAAGRRLPHDPHRQVPQRLRRRTVRQRHRRCRPAGTPGTRCSSADTDHYFYGYTLNNNGAARGPLRRLGQLGNARIRRPRRHRLPLRAAQRAALPLRDRHLQLDGAAKKCWPRRPNSPSTCSSTTPRPHGDFRRPAGPEPAPRHYDWFKGAPLPHDRSEGFDEGNVTDKPRFIREAEHLTPDRQAHLPRLLREAARVAALDRRRASKQIVDTLGQLHRLRNTYILFTSDNGFFFGEHRLIGGKFLAYEPATHLPFLIRGPGIEPGSSTGELAANIDIAPTILELAGVEADKSIDGRSLVPFLRDPELRTRRPILFESFVETSDVEANGAISTASRGSALPPGGATPRSLAPPQGLRGDPPRPLQVHRLARRREGALRHQQGPVRAQQHRQGAELLPDPQLPPPRAAALRELRRARLPRSDAAAAADPDRSRTLRRAQKIREQNGTRKGTARTRTGTAEKQERQSSRTNAGEQAPP